MNNPLILKNLEKFESDLKILSDINANNQKIIDSNKDYILEQLEQWGMSEGNYYEIIKENDFSELSIGDLKSIVGSPNLLDALMVTVTIDFEATRENLKVNFGLEDGWVENIIDGLKKKSIATKSVLKLKQAIK